MPLGPGAPQGNVFVAKRTITDVANQSAESQSDVCIKLFFEKFIGKDGTEKEPTVNIYGDFEKNPDRSTKVDANGAPVGWGSAFKIDRLINHIGGWNGQLTSTEIPDEALLPLVGKTVHVLTYKQRDPKNPKYPWATYQVLAAEQEKKGGELMDGGDWLREFFEDQVAKGKVKNYAG